jgi:signal transduction histidine kinase
MREGVGNAVRHSHAAALIITVAVEDEPVVQVIDDGVGGADPEAGEGLRDLARRARDVAGSFTVSGADGGGTPLVWTAPPLP